MIVQGPGFEVAPAYWSNPSGKYARTAGTTNRIANPRRTGSPHPFFFLYLTNGHPSAGRSSGPRFLCEWFQSQNVEPNSMTNGKVKINEFMKVFWAES